MTTQARPEARPSSLGTAVLAGVPVVAAIATATVDAHGGGTWCPFALATGIACPLCGMTRGVAATLSGDLAGSWVLHPMAVVVVVAGLLGWGAVLGARLGWWRPPPTRLWPRLLGAGVVATTVVWIARLAIGALPPV